MISFAMLYASVNININGNIKINIKININSNIQRWMEQTVSTKCLPKRGQTEQRDQKRGTRSRGISL